MSHKNYGFVDSEENPFDDGPMPAPVRQAPRSAGPKQPRAVAPSAAGQPLPPPQPRVAAAAPAQPQQPRAAPAQPRAAPAQPRAAPPAARQSVSTSGQAVAAAVPVAAVAVPASKASFKVPNPFGSAAPKSGEPLDDIALREANLKAREAKMLAKEQQLEVREREVKEAGIKIKNWPFRRCALYHHDISEEIPPHLQPMVKKYYFNVMFTWIGLLWNVITVFTYWGESDSDQGTILCLLWLVPGIPGSWHMWYFRVYKAARNSSSRQYLCSFVGFCIHLMVMLVLGLGTPSSGAGGLLVMLKAFAGGYSVSGVFALIDTVLLLSNLLFSTYLLKLSRDAWRTGGGATQLKKDKGALKMLGSSGIGVV